MIDCVFWNQSSYELPWCGKNPWNVSVSLAGPLWWESTDLPVTDGFTSQMASNLGFDVFCYVNQNKLLKKTVELLFIWGGVTPL